MRLAFWKPRQYEHKVVVIGELDHYDLQSFLNGGWFIVEKQEYPNVVYNHEKTEFFYHIKVMYHLGREVK